MINVKAYELLCCQQGLANEEKSEFHKQYKELITRLESIEKSNRGNSKTFIETIKELKDAPEKQSINRDMIVLTKRMMIKRPMVTILVAIPLLKMYLHITSTLQGERKSHRVQKRAD